MGVQKHREYDTPAVLKRCRRCVLPENCPNIRFDENGVCNVCRDFERRWGRFKQPDYLRSKKIELERIFNSNRKKAKSYDCLVPVSGGMDSTYVLYVCKKIYNLRVFALNFDNGFQSKFAIENLKNAVEELDVDFVSYRPSWELQRRLYALFFRRTGEFCTPCNVGIRSLSHKFARDLGIPLIVSGASDRIEVQYPRGAHIYHWSKTYFKEVIRGEISFKEAADYLHVPQGIVERVLSRISTHIPFGRRVKTIPLPDYLEWDLKKRLDILRSEVKWQHYPGKREHTDCIMDPVRVYLRQKKWGLSASLKYGTLVRNGQIDRKQALERTLCEEAIASKEPPILERWLELLNLSRKDLDGFERRSQLPYISIRRGAEQRVLKTLERTVGKVFR